MFLVPSSSRPRGCRVHRARLGWLLTAPRGGEGWGSARRGSDAAGRGGRNRAAIRLRGDLPAWAGRGRTWGRLHSGAAHALPGREAKLERSLGDTTDERVSRNVCDCSGRGTGMGGFGQELEGCGSLFLRAGWGKRGAPRSGGENERRGRPVPRGASPQRPPWHNATLDTLCCITSLRDSPIGTGWCGVPLRPIGFAALWEGPLVFVEHSSGRQAERRTDRLGWMRSAEMPPALGTHVELSGFLVFWGRCRGRGGSG